MSKKEYLEKIKQTEINVTDIKKVSQIYGQMPGIIGQMLSFSEESIFFDDGWRTLSFSEIIEAEKDLHIGFAAMKLIPVVDCGENDFIVYHFDDDTWSKFNIIDECVFKKKNSLAELF